MIKWDGELIAFVSDPANAPENLYPTGEYIDYTALPVAEKKSTFNFKTLAVLGVAVLGFVLILRRG